MLAHYTQEIQ